MRKKTTPKTPKQKPRPADTLSKTSKKKIQVSNWEGPWKSHGRYNRGDSQANTVIDAGRRAG